MTRVALSRSKGQRSRSRGQLVLRRKMCHNFVADRATLFKCRTLTDCGQFLFTDCKLPPKWAWRGDVTQFRNFATLSIFCKRLKLCFSNLAQGLESVSDLGVFTLFGQTGLHIFYGSHILKHFCLVLNCANQTVKHFNLLPVVLITSGLCH